MTIRSGREVGTIFNVGGGDLSSWARRGLAVLRGRMATTGQVHGADSEELPNGDIAHYEIMLSGPVPVLKVSIESNGTRTLIIKLVSDAFMESGWAKVTNGVEESFEAVLYPTDTQSNMIGGYPTWLDWVGYIEGVLHNPYRSYYSGMPSLAMEFDKVVVSPTPQFLVCTVSGKMQMLAQAQYGTQLGVGTVSLQDYLDGGGTVTRTIEVD